MRGPPVGSCFRGWQVHVRQADLNLLADRELVETFKVFILGVQRSDVREIVANNLRAPGPVERGDGG